MSSSGQHDAQDQKRGSGSHASSPADSVNQHAEEEHAEDLPDQVRVGET